MPSSTQKGLPLNLAGAACSSDTTSCIPHLHNNPLADTLAQGLQDTHTRAFRALAGRSEGLSVTQHRPHQHTLSQCCKPATKRPGCSQIPLCVARVPTHTQTHRWQTGPRACGCGRRRASAQKRQIGTGWCWSCLANAKPFKDKKATHETSQHTPLRTRTTCVCLFWVKIYTRK